MGTVASGFSVRVPAVFLLAEVPRRGESLLLSLSKKDDISVVGAGSYSPAIFEQIVSTGANVVVLDSVAPVLAEHGVMRELHQINPAIRVVLVGMEADEAIFLRVVQAGVVGYVLKDASAVELARTIRAVAAGEAVCPAVLSTGLFRWVARHKSSIPSLHLKNRLGLSRREQELVGLIRQGVAEKENA